MAVRQIAAGVANNSSSIGASSDEGTAATDTDVGDGITVGQTAEQAHVVRTTHMKVADRYTVAVEVADKGFACTDGLETFNTGEVQLRNTVGYLEVSVLCPRFSCIDHFGQNQHILYIINNIRIVLTNGLRYISRT